MTLASELRSQGHEVWSPTLTGFGERQHLDTSNVTFETFVTDIVSVLKSVPQTPEMARAVVSEEDGTAGTIPHLMIEALLPEPTPEDRAWVLERHRPYPPHALVERGPLAAFKALGLPTRARVRSAPARHRDA